MAYIEGFLTPVPHASKEDYLVMARKAAELIKEFGATRLVEAWGDDLMDGKVTDFKRAVAAEDGENVVFSWVEYPDKATRDKANRRMMEDERFAAFDMPFDGKRMVFSGFVPIFDTAGQLV